MEKNILLLLGLLFAVAPVWAHHAFAAEFDVNKPLKLRGTVTKMEVINPTPGFTERESGQVSRGR